jgi:hypothetical protein
VDPARHPRRTQANRPGAFTTGSSAASSTRSPSTAPSPKPPAEERPRGAHRSIAANRA